MAIKYKTDDDRGLIIVSIDGELTAQQLMGYFQVVHPDPRINGYDRLMFIGPLREAISAREIAAIAHYARHSAGANTDHKTAIIATTDLGLQIARHYQKHRHSKPRKFSVFSNLEKALKWMRIREMPAMDGLTEVSALSDDFYSPMHRVRRGPKRAPAKDLPPPKQYLTVS